MNECILSWEERYVKLPLSLMHLNIVFFKNLFLQNICLYHIISYLKYQISINYSFLLIYSYLLYISQLFMVGL